MPELRGKGNLKVNFFVFYTDSIWSLRFFKIIKPTLFYMFRIFSLLKGENMAYCQNCGSPVTGNVCSNCGQSVTQMPTQPMQQAPPQYPPPNFSMIAITLLFVGAILLACGVFALALVPDEIKVGDFEGGSYQNPEVSFGVELTGYKVGVVLIGLGILLEGMASALVTKEHFRRLDEIKAK